MAKPWGFPVRQKMYDTVDGSEIRRENHRLDGAKTLAIHGINYQPGPQLFFSPSPEFWLPSTV